MFNRASPSHTSTQIHRIVTKPNSPLTSVPSGRTAVRPYLSIPCNGRVAEMNTHGIRYWRLLPPAASNNILSRQGRNRADTSHCLREIAAVPLKKVTVRNRIVE